MSWRLVSIKDLSEQVQSWNPAKTNNDESTFVYVDLSAVDKNKKEIDLSNVQNITPKGAPSRARQIVKKHDVLVSTVRPNLNGVALVPSILDGATASTGYCVIRVNEERLNPKFLYHWLQTDLFVSDMISKATGANYPAVSDRLIKESKIPLPPLAEQKRIADILDKADGIRRKRQQAMDLADEFLRATFLDMFGDPVTNPKGWPVNVLRDNLKFLTSGSRGWAKYYSDTGQMFIRIKNVGNNELLLEDMAYVQAPSNAEAARTRVQLGDVLLSITADLGRTAVVTDEIGGAYINQHLALLRLDTTELNPQFLSAQLGSKAGLSQFLSLNKSAVKAGLNFTDIKQFKIINPPLSLQNKFEKVFNATAAVLCSLNKSCTLLENTFDAISQKAFKGELSRLIIKEQN